MIVAGVFTQPAESRFQNPGDAIDYACYIRLLRVAFFTFCTTQLLRILERVGPNAYRERRVLLLQDSFPLPTPSSQILLQITFREYNFATAGDGRRDAAV